LDDWNLYTGDCLMIGGLGMGDFLDPLKVVDSTITSTHP